MLARTSARAWAPARATARRRRPSSTRRACSSACCGCASDAGSAAPAERALRRAPYTMDKGKSMNAWMAMTGRRIGAAMAGLAAALACPEAAAQALAPMKVRHDWPPRGVQSVVHLAQHNVVDKQAVVV